MILKQFVFGILQLLDFFFLEKRWFALMLVILSLMKVRHKVTFYFYSFQSEGLKKKLKILFGKNCLFLNTHFISMNNNE